MRIRAALAIARANVVRLLRDRLGLFFIFVLPLIIIVVTGLQFGTGFLPRIGVVAVDVGELGDELVTRLASDDETGWEIREFDSVDGLTDAVERRQVDVGVVLPTGYDEQLRAGGIADVILLSPPGDTAIRYRTTLASAIGEQATVLRAATFAADEGVASFDDALATARSLQALLPGVSVRVTTAGEEFLPGELLGFGLGAHSQLILFMFLTSLTGAAQLILSRTLGVSRRMLSTPTPIGTILIGEALGRFGVALLQGLFIVFATMLAFGVDWGDPLGAAIVVILFALVGSGAAMLIGAVANNAEQASGLGVMAGLGIAAIGGAMVPPEIFPPTIDTVSHVTPHRWAIEALRDLVSGGGIGSIGPELAVLAGFAVVLLGLATWRLRAALTR